MMPFPWTFKITLMTIQFDKDHYPEKGGKIRWLCFRIEVTPAFLVRYQPIVRRFQGRWGSAER